MVDDNSCGDVCALADGNDTFESLNLSRFSVRLLGLKDDGTAGLRAVMLSENDENDVIPTPQASPRPPPAFQMGH